MPIPASQIHSMTPAEPINGTELIEVTQTINGAPKTRKMPLPDVATLNIPAQGTGGVVRSSESKFDDTSNGRDFGAVGDGVANDTPKIQALIDHVASKGGGIAEVNEGTYQILTPLVLKSGVVLRGQGTRTKLRIGALTYAFLTQGSLSADLTNTLAANAAISANSFPLAAGKGANFVAGDYCLLTSEAAMPMGASANKRAEIVRVKTAVGDTITVESPLVYAYNTADTARLRKITMVIDCGIEDLTIDGNYIANSATFRRSQTVFSWCLRPRVKNVRFRDLGQQAISFGGCVAWLVQGCQYDDLASNDASEYGYAVHETAINVGGRMSNCTGERVRHMYTTTGASTPFAPGYGQPMGTRIIGCTALWPRAAGFDTHEDGLDISFSGCTVVGGGRAGFQLRSLRTSVADCVVTDCVGQAVYIDSSAEDSFIKNVRSLRTSTGTDDLGVNHIDIGTIFDNGKRTTVTDCRIDLCGGPAIQAFTGATGFFYERNLIRNPAQLTAVAASKCGIWLNNTAVIEGDVHGNRVVVTDGKATTGINLSSNNASVFMTGNRVTPTVPTPYVLGTQVQHQGNSPGPLLSVGQMSQTLTIAAGVIDVTGLQSPSFLIAGEGGVADDLVTINGGVSGQMIFIRRATGVNITLKHGTGNIFLQGSADKIIGGSYDTIQLYKLGGGWIGNFLADV